MFNWNGKTCEVQQDQICCETDTEEMQCSQPRDFIQDSVQDEGFNEWAEEVACLKDVPAGPEQYHEEGSALRHTALVADEALDRRPGDETAFFAALSHDLGKCNTPEEDHPLHRGHAQKGVEPAQKLAEKMGVSQEEATAMTEAARFHMRAVRIPEMRESKVVRMVDELSGLSTDQLVDLAEADKAGREPKQELPRQEIEGKLGRAEKAVQDFGREEAFEQFDADESNVDDIVLQQRIERIREQRD